MHSLGLRSAPLSGVSLAVCPGITANGLIIHDAVLDNRLIGPGIFRRRLRRHKASQPRRGAEASLLVLGICPGEVTPNGIGSRFGGACALLG